MLNFARKQICICTIRIITAELRIIAIENILFGLDLGNYLFRNISSAIIMINYVNRTLKRTQQGQNTLRTL